MGIAFEIDHDEFERNAGRHLRVVVRAALDAVAVAALAPVRAVVAAAVVASPEYASLLGGVLRRDFGIEDPQAVLAAVVAGVQAGVRVTSLAGAGDVLGVLKVEALHADMSDVLGLPEASYVSLSLRRGTRTLVDWLRWLLLAGDAVVIAEWEAKSDRPSFTSTRTGLGVMVRPTRRPSRGFVVPEFSGIVDDNWLTRCLAAAAPGVQGALGRCLEQV